MAEVVRTSANEHEGERVVLFAPECWSGLQRHFGLSRRQTETCKLVCAGCANKQIAAELGITLDTVRMHLRDVFRKMEVRTRVDVVVSLVIAAREHADAGAEV